MLEEKGKAAWQSLGITGPAISLLAFYIAKVYGVEVPVEIQGYVVTLVDVLIPLAFVLAAWGRIRAKKVIARWF